MPTVIKELELDFVSLVDRGAGEGVKIALCKRDKTNGGVMPEGEKQLAELQKHNDELTAQVAALQSKIDELSAQPEPEPDPIEKADPVIKAEIEALRKRAENAEALAKTERDERLTKDAIAKAASYGNLPCTPAELGPVLKRASESLPKEDNELLDRLFAAYGAIAKQSSVMKAVGHSGGDENSAWSQIEKAASELVKSGVVKTQAEGVSRVVRDQPDLYRQYRAEQH